jgi:hypothetical protein
VTSSSLSPHRLSLYVGCRNLRRAFWHMDHCRANAGRMTSISGIECSATKAKALTRFVASFGLSLMVSKMRASRKGFPSRRARRHQHILPNPTGVNHGQMTPFCQRDHFEIVVVDEHNCDLAGPYCLIKVC